MFAQKNNGRALVNVIIILVVLAAGVFVALRSLRSTARVMPVGRGTAVDAVTGSVIVTADGGFKEVKSEAGGKVAEAQAINKNSRFTKRAPLLQLDTTELDRQISETQRNFKATKERWEIQLRDNPEETIALEALTTAKRLYELGTASQEQLKSAQRALDQVRRNLALAKFDREKTEADYKETMENFRLQKEKMTVVAPPFDGVVREPLTWEGAIIGPGQPIATVYANARVVAVKISEESFGKVKVGQKARLRLLTYGSKEFDATVSKLLPTADESQRFEVWLDVKADPELLLPNSTGEATITVDEHLDQVVIQRRALLGNDTVFVVENGVVRRRQVKVGYMALNEVEIREGLNVGEHVIVDYLDEFRDGQRVSVDVLK